MSDTTPLVSVIITSYNYGRYIGQTIQSVLGQTYSHWELLVSDDGSSDNSLEIIRSFQDPRINVITSDTNQGAVNAYRKAYDLCRGEYLSSLNSDDYIAPEKLERQVQYLQQHPQVDILGTFAAEIGSNGQTTKDVRPYENWFNRVMDLNCVESWLWENHLCHSSVLMQKSVHDRFGLFHPELVRLGDYEFWIRCLVGGATFDVLPEKLTFYRSHGANISVRDPQRILLEQVYIFGAHVKPYLIQSSRQDLVGTAVANLLALDRYYGQSNPEIKAHVVDNLLQAESQWSSFQELLDSLREPVENKEWVELSVVDALVSRYEHEKVRADEQAKAKIHLLTERDHWKTVATKSEQQQQCWQQTAQEQRQQQEHWQQVAQEQQQQREHWQQVAQEQQQQREHWQQVAQEQQQQREHWQQVAQEQSMRLQKIDAILKKSGFKSLIRMGRRLGFLR